MPKTKTIIVRCRNCDKALGCYYIGNKKMRPCITCAYSDVCPYEKLDHERVLKLCKICDRMEVD